MPRRKERLKRLNEKREEREKTKIKKHTYKEMSKKGELGCMELEKYTSMYEGLPKEKRHNYKSPYNPNNKPNRLDYNCLKRNYFNSDNSSSLENKSMNYSPLRSFRR